MLVYRQTAVCPAFQVDFAVIYSKYYQYQIDKTPNTADA